MKVFILIDTTAEAKDCIKRIYSSEKRANQDHELLNDKESYLLKEFEVFPSVNRKKKVKE